MTLAFIDFPMISAPTCLHWAYVTSCTIPNASESAVALSDAVHICYSASYTINKIYTYPAFRHTYNRIAV